MKNYYSILEINFTSSQEDIKRAYRIMAVRYHPDKHHGDPFLTEKFIDAREAYDMLSNLETRIIYDIEYKKNIYDYENVTDKRKEQGKTTDGNKFQPDPFKPFFSFFERNVQETPQLVPKYNHLNEIIQENAHFFVLPKKIGYILSGQTSLTKDWKPLVIKNKTWKNIKSALITAIVIGWIITGICVQAGAQNLYIVGVGALIGGTVGYIFSAGSSEIGEILDKTAYSSFIGVNGFAHYTYDASKAKILEEFELNFNDVTDFIKITETKKTDRGFETSYLYQWQKNDIVIKKYEGVHTRSNNISNVYQYSDYFTNNYAENSWTMYLLDKMENEITQKGYIDFKLVGKHPYIRLGLGYIEIIKENATSRYNFYDIKKMYVKKELLFLEHKNDEKKFFFFESGNKDGISLELVANSKFFYAAAEILLGYKIIQD